MLRPIYHKDSQFSIWCDLDGLVQLAQDLGFHICRSINEYTDRQKYVAAPQDELAEMWRKLEASPRCFESQKIWDANYLVAEPDRHYTETDLAAIITPHWLYQGRWYFHLGLNWSWCRDPLPGAALKLIEAVFDNHKGASDDTPLS